MCHEGQVPAAGGGEAPALQTKGLPLAKRGGRGLSGLRPDGALCWAIAFAFTLLFAFPAHACGPDTNCQIGTRHYRISMPPNHDGTTKLPAVLWSHGWRGSAAGVMRNGSLKRMLHDQGFALIAAHGIDGGWDLPNGPRDMASTGAAEFAYFDAIIADATTRFAIDPDRIVASGFSLGGMMTWNLACARPGKYAGFIPIAGTFWLEPPETCAQPANHVIHIHGTADTTVPLTGRVIGPTKQGVVAEVLEMYADFGGFAGMDSERLGPLDCAGQTNPDGKLLMMCFFQGGHSFRTEYLRLGLARLKQQGAF